jgi:hypothetical protein
MSQLPHLYRSMIATLYEAGGAAKKQLDGRLKVPSTMKSAEHLLVGSANDWLGVAERGMIAGNGEHFVLTEAGRAEAEAIVAGRTRTAAGF